MFLIDFQKTSSQAFFHGFVKGLGAPVMLFHYEAASAMPAIFQVSASSIPIDQALIGDWCRVGSDIRTVIARHQEENSIREDRSIKHAKHTRKSAAKKSRSKRR